MTNKLPSGTLISGKSGKVAAQVQQVKGADALEFIPCLILREELFDKYI